jgi:Zn-dependent protease with chaperone function
MISLIRLAGALLGVGTALSTVVMLPLFLIQQCWYWAYSFLGGRIPDLTLPTDMDLAPALAHVTSWPPFTWSQLPLSPPPDISWVWRTSMEMLIPLVALLAISHLLVSMRQRIRSAAGMETERVDRDHPLQVYINDMAAQHRTGKIGLYLLPDSGVTAFVLSSPFRRHAIVASRGLLGSAPLPVVKWVLAHEIAHIYYGDTQSTSLWLLAMRGIYLFARIRAQVASITLHALRLLPILRLLVGPLYSLIRLVFWVGRLGRRLGQAIFLVFDRWASRLMEYRADRFAAEHAGAEPGIALFRALIGHFEPRFDLFASHPTHVKRIEALSAWQRDQDRSASKTTPDGAAPNGHSGPPA